MSSHESFYVVRRESGTERNDLPVWAPTHSNPFQLERDYQGVSRKEVENIPGAFQLLNVLKPDEVQRILEATAQLGFTEDAAVSLPREVRHNNNLNFIADTDTLARIWQRCGEHFSDKYGHFGDKKPLGINGRFRFYRYDEGDYFKMHIDGSWPGSQVIDQQLVDDAFGDRWSMYTFLILLSDEFEGGETEFMVNRDDPTKPARQHDNAKVESVRTPSGSVLCFPHGAHPYHCLHGSAQILSGTKHIIRTDVLFEL
ncbi:oxidoreductase [Vibrio harveyi]|uniref:oxidoreductase n=1 Tax=Vibrio harveyi TaxID=669 RepID=UPI001EFD226A|nr:oxidoreductase [Vibrio harveyi]MCG9612760.1 oxidoreductase [Vibrio harveyi]MCG9671237.1 oxidoreductase [Vibrio harveyi]